METRANYALIGGFTLAVLVAVFGFVIWFKNMGTAKTRIGYRIVFDGAVTGLRTGANVNFNGIRIGEVASVKIDDPHKVVAMIRVERKAPVRKDTQDRPRVSGPDRHRRDLDEGRRGGCAPRSSRTRTAC